MLKTSRMWRLGQGNHQDSRLALPALLLILSAGAIFAQQPPAAIQGKVQDTSGNPVSGASVRLEHSGNPALRTRSGPDGEFSFKGLVSGDYTLFAEKDSQHSRAVGVIAHSESGKPLVCLVLEGPGPAKQDSGGGSAAPAMDFADNPNFAIAGVTDWTAAGGHGSDSVLRASEALNREALGLKPTGAGTTHEPVEEENTLRAALAGAPNDFAANHNLGHFYLQAGRFHDAVPPLGTAYKIDPSQPENEYELALALKDSGDLAQARQHAQALLAHHESADAHRLAGEIDEEMGDSLPAVRELERAVQEDPSEQNYFEWGSELLLHRAVWQAKGVFSAGVTAYPNSARMLTALGAALFAGALYEEAAQRLCQASELNPSDPQPYLFMGRVEVASPNPLNCVEQKLARFVELHPNESLASYYYAMAIWKQRGQSIDSPTLQRVQDLLNRAVTIDPQCGDGYFQLGVLEATRGDYQKAIGYYSKAIEVNPQLSQAHYRLGVAYDRVGDKDRAKREFQLHDQIKKQQAADVDKQRREVKQFLVVVDGKNSSSNPD